MELIVIGTEAYRKLRQEIFEEMRIFLNAWAAAQKQHNSDNTDWLSPEEARARLHVKSRKKMQALRSSGEIHYMKNGREYLYDAISIERYMNNKSTKKYSLTTPQKTKNKLK